LEFGVFGFSFLEVWFGFGGLFRYLLGFFSL